MQIMSPCPFCGHSNLLGVERRPDDGFLAVHCRKCGCIGPSGRSASGESRAGDIAIAHWNAREEIYVPLTEISQFLDQVAVRVLQQRIGRPMTADLVGRMKVEMRYLSRQHPDLPAGARVIDIDLSKPRRARIAWSWNTFTHVTELRETGSPRG